MKEVQEHRNKRFFIDACKTLIRGEGIQAVSARTVAEEAGYSYATLYNYFKDIKDLVGICVDEFIAESADFIKSQNISETGKAGIYKKIVCFSRYFLQYPGIFHAVFTEDIRELRTPISFKEKLDQVFNDALLEDFRSLDLPDHEISAKMELLKLSTYAMLLLFLNRRCPTDYKAFTEYFDNVINSILK